MEDLLAFKHNYFPIYYGMTEYLGKNTHKSSKESIFKTYDPLFQSFY